MVGTRYIVRETSKKKKNKKRGESVVAKRIEKALIFKKIGLKGK
jgi:hypothetical protein